MTHVSYFFFMKIRGRQIHDTTTTTTTRRLVTLRAPEIKKEGVAGVSHKPLSFQILKWKHVGEM